MTEFVRFAVLGLATGGAYAMLGLGLVVVYRSTGVVNFAHAAVAVSAGYVYFDLSSGGTDPLPAAAAGVASGLVLGLLLYVVTILPLRGSSALTKGMATLAGLVVIQSVITMRYGSEPRSPRSFLPQRRLEILGTTVTWDMLAMLILSTGLALFLGFVYGRTKFGYSTTAVSENEFVFSTLGRSSSLVMVANWAIGGALAGIAGVLIVPIVGLNPSLATVLLIPGLAVALCAQFSSFTLTFIGALAIGVLQAELSYYSTQGPLSAVTGLAQAAPFLVIITLLVVFGRTLPTRGFVTAALPWIGAGQISRPWIGFWVLTGMAGVAFLRVDWVIALTTSFIAAILLLSFVVVTGYAGQLSLAQVSIAGVGVFVASALVAHAGWPMPVAAVVGIAATVPVSFLVGLPALRTRGVTLAVVTLGLAEALNATFFTRQDVNQLGRGLEVGVPNFFGIDFSEVLEPRRYALLALGILALLVVGISNMRRSSIGKLLVAVRANERAAAALGINVAGAKLYAFVLAGALAGTAGILAAWRLPYVLFSTGYGSFASIGAAVNATLGGIGYIGGAIFGGLVGDPGSLGGTLASELGFGEWFFVIMSSFLLLNIVLNPNGVVPSVLQLGKVIAGRVKVSVSVAALPRRRRADQAADSHLFAAPRDTPSRHASVLLQVRGLRVVFGATTALDGIDLDCRGGEVIGIIGPNGAGKTTFIDALTGYVQAQGTISLDGSEIQSKAAYRRSRAGISRSFQSLELFEELSVADNLLVAADRIHWSRWLTCFFWPGRHQPGAAARIALAELGLSSAVGRSPHELPNGRRRLVAISRALATSPKVLLLDEPAAGLGEAERVELRHLIRRLADEWGMAVLVVEHDVELVLGVSDRVVALNFGRKIAEGTPSEVRRHPEVVQAYLGTDDDAPSDVVQTTKGARS